MVSKDRTSKLTDFLLRVIKGKDLECFLLHRVKISRRVRFYYKNSNNLVLGCERHREVIYKMISD